MANPLPHEPVSFRRWYPNTEQFGDEYPAALLTLFWEDNQPGEALYVRLANDQLVIVRPRPQHEERGDG